MAAGLGARFPDFHRPMSLINWGPGSETLKGPEPDMGLRVLKAL